MRYTFTLDRWSMIQATGGLILVLLLVFVAGIVVGLRLQLPARLAAASSDSSAVAATRARPSSTGTSAAATTPPTTDSVPSPSSEDADVLASAAAADDSLSRATNAEGWVDSTVASLASPTSDAKAVEPSAPSRSPDASTTTEGTTPTTDAATIDAPFTVQLGAFAKQVNAETLAQKVRADGYSVAIRAKSRNGRTLHYVWAGAYESSRAAARAVSTFASYAPGAFAARAPSEAAVAQAQ